MKRIGFLDGFRGIAILLVFFFHVFSRWTEKVPYGKQYADIVFFNKGWLGVYLFFLISGFVILMSLERNKNFIDFIKSRWLRLFPGMFIATVFIYSSASFFFERPNGVPNLIDTIPGLLFIDKVFFIELLHLNLGIFEGAFWSIFVEVKYYFVFGLLYFLLGKTKGLVALMLLFFVYNAVFYFNLNFDIKYFGLIEMVLFKLGCSYYAWFASGSLAFMYYKSKDFKLLIISLLIGIVAVFALKENTNVVVFAFGLLVLFLATIQFELLKKIIANKLFLFFGFISYPFYLIHENMSIALIIKMYNNFLQSPNLILVAIAFLIVTLLAFVVVKYLEPNIQKPLKSLLNRPNN